MIVAVELCSYPPDLSPFISPEKELFSRKEETERVFLSQNATTRWCQAEKKAISVTMNPVKLYITER
jgi:hypothetical protein